MNQGIRDELLDRGLSDILQLAELIGVTARHCDRAPDDEEVRQVVLAVIGELLDSGYAIFGDVTTNDEGLLQIESWGVTTSDTVKRIETEWDALGRPPDLGEVGWLELTDAGRAEARAQSAVRRPDHGEC